MTSFIQLFKIAFKIFRRDWRRGDLLVLIFAMSIAMASVSVIYLIIDRVESATNRQAAQILGADLIISSPKPIEPEWLEKAKTQQLESAKVISFASVLFANDKLQLSAVKAVTTNYPLKGRVEIADTPSNPSMVASGIPLPGNIWVEPRIFAVLEASTGQPVELGYRDLKLSKAIMLQPGQGSTLFNIAPTAIINIADLESTKIIQPGSRVNYQYLFVGDEKRIAAFKDLIEPLLDTSQRISSIFDESPVAGSAITRSKKYISLSGLLTLILLGVAIAMSANRYARRQFDMSALMRCFGMNNREVLLIFTFILLIVAAVGIFSGAILGLSFQSFMVTWLSELFGEQLPPANFTVLFYPLLASLILLLGFALPSLLQLKNVPPMRVLRRQLTPMKMATGSIYLTAILSLFGIMYLQMGDLRLLSGVLAAVGLMLLLFAILAFLLIAQVRRLSRTKSAAVNYSLRQLDANKGVTMLHLIAFSLTLFVVALVILVRTELLEKWQQSLGKDVPDHFMVNIAADEVPQVNDFLEKNDIASTELFPMVRGRIVKINDIDIKQAVSEVAQQHNSLRRELNMTWTDHLPKGNKITQGEWLWDNKKGPSTDSSNASIAGQISIDEKTANILGLKLEDKITFGIGSEEWTARITSFRSIDWQTFTPNFYIIANPGSLARFNATYISAFRMGKDKKSLLPQLIASHPTATVIELDRIFDEIRAMVAKVTAAIELIMVFVVSAGLALLWAAMEHNFSQKLRQSAILRTLGASKSFLSASFRFEFLWLAVISAAIAVICVEFATYFLYQNIFNIDFYFHFNLWWQLPLGLLLLMLVASWRGVKKVAEPAPLSLIR